MGYTYVSSSVSEGLNVKEEEKVTEWPVENYRFYFGLPIPNILDCTYLLVPKNYRLCTYLYLQVSLQQVLPLVPVYNKTSKNLILVIWKWLCEKNVLSSMIQFVFYSYMQDGLCIWTLSTNILATIWNVPKKKHL